MRLSTKIDLVIFITAGIILIFAGLVLYFSYPQIMKEINTPCVV